MTDALYHLYQTLYWSIAALLVVGTIAFVGSPLLLVVRALRPKLNLSLGLALLVGQCELIVSAWFAFRAKQPFAIGVAWIMSANLALLVVAGAMARARVRAAIADWFDAIVARRNGIAAFCLYAVLLAFAVTLSLGRNDLNLVTIGNSDLFHYIKLAHFVIDPSDGPGNIAGYDLRSAVLTGATGAYAIIALAALLLGSAPVDVAIAPMVAAGALIGAAVGNICQHALRLSRTISFCFGLLVLGNSLVLSLVANYFLAQLWSAAMLLVAVDWFLSAARVRNFDFVTVTAVGIALGAHVLLTYPVLFVPDFMLFGLLAAWLHFACGPSTALWPLPWKRLLRAALMGLGIAVIVAIVLFVLTQDRFLQTLRDLAALDQFSGGWPLGLVSPLSMIGIPVSWHDGLGPVAWLDFLAVTALAAVSFVVLARDRAAGHLIPMTTLGISTAFFLGYLLVWIKFGFSYQQWKFAGSYPAIFGFAILATWAYAVRVYPLTGDLRRGWKRLTANFLGAGLVLLAAYNWADSVSTWLIDVMHFPKELKAISRVDDMPEISALVVDLGDHPQRMAAAAFIHKKKITFLEPTSYGLGPDPSMTASPSTPILRESPQCGARAADKILAEGLVLTTEAAWPLDIGQPIFFAKTFGACLRVEGASAPEAGGRWTQAREVTFSFQCRCRESDGGLGVALTAGAFIVPGKVERQRVRVSVNGTPMSEWILTDQGRQRHVISLPADARAANRIEIRMELPDAARPNPSDSRVLALSLIDFTLVRLPPDAGK